MADYYLKKNWDVYWKKHQDKKILDILIAKLRPYFGSSPV